MYIAVINTEESVIDALENQIDGEIIDNGDGESYSVNGDEYLYYAIDIKQMPIDDITVYEVYLNKK